MIDILMATYNGENYIDIQISSIITQTFPEWRLIIHDDGSTDNTVKILNEWVKKDKRIIFIDDEYYNLGPGRNFMHLLQFSNAPFICFCDQDDMWFENKLEILFSEISNKDNTIPQVIYSDAYVWNSDSNIIGNKLLSIYGKHPNTYNDFLFQGSIHGCTSFFNAEMLKLINITFDYVNMHDQILTYAGILTNGISYVDKCLLLYRQHSNAVTSNIIPNKRSYLKTVLFHHTKVPVIDYEHYCGVRSFYQCYTDSFKKEHRELFEEFIRYPEMNAVKRFISLITNKFRVKKSSLYLLIKVILRKKFVIKEKFITEVFE